MMQLYDSSERKLQSALVDFLKTFKKQIESERAITKEKVLWWFSLNGKHLPPNKYNLFFAKLNSFGALFQDVPDNDEIAHTINYEFFKELPDEIMLQIMLYLRIKDMLNLRLTEKNWNRLFHDQRLINDVFPQALSDTFDKLLMIKKDKINDSSQIYYLSELEKYFLTYNNLLKIFESFGINIGDLAHKHELFEQKYYLIKGVTFQKSKINLYLRAGCGCIPLSYLCTCLLSGIALFIYYLDAGIVGGKYFINVNVLSCYEISEEVLEHASRSLYINDFGIDSGIFDIRIISICSIAAGMIMGLNAQTLIKFLEYFFIDIVLDSPRYRIASFLNDNYLQIKKSLLQIISAGIKIVNYVAIPVAVELIIKSAYYISGEWASNIEFLSIMNNCTHERLEKKAEDVLSVYQNSLEKSSAYSFFSGFTAVFAIFAIFHLITLLKNFYYKMPIYLDNIKQCFFENVKNTEEALPILPITINHMNRSRYF